MPENSHRFFRNTACAYFPCHEVDDETQFNCLFCFCPLYWLEDCDGTPAFRGGVKDCTGCTLPHAPQGYDTVLARLRREFARRAGRPDDET
ncbi:cysteine-rich small domain-containing protein [Desulfocurvus vexinensis]|uniref:cysteine-rich small domain-containing protein n=1 Tax=Desulfocurvus vexinensis TaxID=399548 RepID=UPI00048DEB3F|nr:cysteine-rich small domain-containing protein [Desulfocurvus vexinensis]